MFRQIKYAESDKVLHELFKEKMVPTVVEEARWETWWLTYSGQHALKIHRFEKRTIVIFPGVYYFFVCIYRNERNNTKNRIRELLLSHSILRKEPFNLRDFPADAVEGSQELTQWRADHEHLVV